jgi:hypothetical protein
MNPRRWFRFSLKALLIVVTVFGCWLGYHLNWIRQRGEALRDTQVANADTAKDFSGLLGGGEPGRPIAPSWLYLFGERGVTSINIWMTADQEADRKKVDEFRRLFPESRVELTPLPTPATH